MDINEVAAYLQAADMGAVQGWDGTQHFEVFPLAQGEYNLNYRVCQQAHQWVFRVNLGTQINRPDQILYGYRALCLLADTGVTPRPYFVDDTRQRLPSACCSWNFYRGSRSITGAIWPLRGVCLPASTHNLPG